MTKSVDMLGFGQLVSGQEGGGSDEKGVTEAELNSRIRWMENTITSLADEVKFIKHERGPRGPPGADGRSGLNGVPGKDGRDGHEGPRGERGESGAVGEQGVAHDRAVAAEFIHARVELEVGALASGAEDALAEGGDAGERREVIALAGALVDGDPTAAGLQADAPLEYGPTEFERGVAPRLAAAAIVLLPASGARPAFTTQYAIDRGTRTLVTQGSREHTHPRPPLQSGQLFTVGRLAIDLGDGPLSFDAKDPRLALLCVSRGVRSELYRVDLRTAAVESLGRIALDEPVTAIALVPRLRGAGTPTATTAAAAAGTR
jgi:hypothetical protein